MHRADRPPAVLVGTLRAARSGGGSCTTLCGRVLGRRETLLHVNSHCIPKSPRLAFYKVSPGDCEYILQSFRGRQVRSPRRVTVQCWLWRNRFLGHERHEKWVLPWAS